MKIRCLPTLMTASVVLFLTHQGSAQIDPLSAWNEGATKQRIVKFVEEVTNQSGTNYVPPAECLSVFALDGTLWIERPHPVEIYFVIHRLKQLAPKNPHWRKTHPFRVLFGPEPKALKPLSKQDMERWMAAAYGGMTLEDLQHEAQKWMATWEHPLVKVGVRGICYEPMRELMEYLRGNGFKTFIITGGSSVFFRTVSEPLYGVPPEQVIGTEAGLVYKVTGGKSFIVHDPKIAFYERGSVKPVALERHIGRRPLIAVGNGESDLELLTYVSDRPAPSLCILIRHDDPERELEYRHEEILKAAQRRGWLMVSIKRDWKSVFPR